MRERVFDTENTEIFSLRTCQALYNFLELLLLEISAGIEARKLVILNQ